VPRIQETVGAIEALLAANSALVRRIGEDTDAGKFPGMAEAGLVKHVVTNNAIEVTSLALSLCGNHGLSQNNDLERHHRNALCGRIHAPQDDTIRIAAGRAALGL
jgi:alkylation response protein AidB-like acyl-CoA dehydrogenase